MGDSSRGIGGLGIRVTGTLAGTVYVESLESTVGSLRSEIARLMGGDPVAVKMIVGGRTLQDDSKLLREAGVNPTSRVLVTRGGGPAAGAAADAGSAAATAAADRTRRLERIRQAAEALAARDSRGLSDDFALDIENQSGSSVSVKPEDRRNLVFGLVMHDKAKDTLRRGDYAAALDELLLAEEALALCDPTLTSAIDNVPLLLLDLVWAAYKLGDLRRLAVSRERLAKAREGLTRAHGPRLERLRSLTGVAFSPELATYLRLEVLEGLVAYYSGESRAAAEASFRSAQSKWQRLQVSDEALAMLQGMGYTLKESRRGLRLSGGDVTAAIDFILEQRKAEEERKARRKRIHDWNYERIKYGKTPAGQYVDPDQLDRLVALGYPRRIAAEALRKNENRGQDALDELSKPDRRRAMELSLALQEGLKATAVNGAATSATAGGTGGAGPSGSGAGPSGSGAGGGEGGEGGNAPSDPALAALRSVAEALAAAQEGKQSTGASPEAAAGTFAAAAGSGRAGSRRREGGGGGGGGGGAAASGDGSASGSDEEKGADKAEVKAAESELVRHVETDPMAAYDIDVTEEGDIIATFLTMLSTAPGGAADGRHAA